MGLLVLAGLGLSFFCSPALLVAVAAAAVAVYFYATRDYGKWEARHGVHSEKPGFFFGNCKDMFTGKKHFVDFHVEYYKKMEGHRFVHQHVTEIVTTWVMSIFQVHHLL